MVFRLFASLVFCLVGSVSGCAQENARMTAQTQCATIMHDLVIAIDGILATNATAHIAVEDLTHSIASSETGLLRRNEKQALVDVWDTPIVIRCTQSQTNLAVTVMSAGADETLATKDDITLIYQRHPDSGKWTVLK